MTVKEIINAVRWCIDEEAGNLSDLSDLTNDMPLMDNIIRSKIGDAIRWISVNGNPALLGGSDENLPTGILVDVDSPSQSDITDISDGQNVIGIIIKMPSDFIKLAWIRCDEWHRSIMNPILDDSEEYLQLRDNYGAKATADRPQAVLVNRNQKAIEAYPKGTVRYTYVADIDYEYEESQGDEHTIPIPQKAKTSLVYYIAFLVLCAYGDARADTMLNIAKMTITQGA